MKSPGSLASNTYLTSSSHELEIDEAAIAPIMSMLSTLYNDPATAVLRELVSNAADAHRSADVRRSVEVRIEATDEGDLGAHMLSVRDFGSGLDHDAIRHVFASYGRSTKTNDNTAIGGFGIGSKSPLALNDHFFVTSYHEGVMSRAVFAIGPSGRPSINYLIEREPSDEPSGVLVEVEIDRHHAEGMIASANATFAFFESGSVCVNGQEVSSVMEHALRVDRFMSLVPNRHLPQFMHSRYAVVEYGGVHYPILRDTMIESPSMSACIVLHAPRGHLSPAPSRESLEDRSDNREVLASLVRRSADRIERAVSADVELAPSPRAAMLRRRRYLTSEATLSWRGSKYPMMLNSGGFSMTGTKVIRHSVAVPFRPDQICHVLVASPPQAAAITDAAAKAFMAQRKIDAFAVVGEERGSDSWLSWGDGEDDVVVFSHDDFTTDVREQRRMQRLQSGPRKVVTYATYYHDGTDVVARELTMREITDLVARDGIKHVWLSTDSWSALDTASRARHTLSIALGTRSVTDAALRRWRGKLDGLGARVATRTDLNAYLYELIVREASDEVMRLVMSKRLTSRDVPRQVAEKVTSARAKELLSGFDTELEHEIVRVRSAVLATPHLRRDYEAHANANDVVPGMRELVSSTLAQSNPSLVAHLIDLVDKEMNDVTP